MSGLPASAEDFSTLVLKAAADDASWRQVLEAVMARVEAVTGAISLRHLETGDIVCLDDPSSEFTEPLIAGLAPEHLASYFDHYKGRDPWSAVERAHHPSEPYFMSTHLPPDELRATEFYQQWLAPLRVCDCLAAEIYRAERYWVALTLLFGRDAGGRRQAILDEIRTLAPVMRIGWGLSEELETLRRGQAAGLCYLEAWPAPCLIIDENFVVTSANALSRREFAAHAPLALPVALGAPLALGPGMLADALAALRHQPPSRVGTAGLVTVASTRPGYAIQVSLVERSEDPLGQRRMQFLILAAAEASAPSARPRTPRIWEADGLTPKQAAIVKWIAEGGSVPNFAAATGKTTKTAYDQLFAARQKLGGISARDIYTSHQALLAMERSSER